MEKPDSSLWEAAKRILRYLGGTIDHGFFLRGNAPVNIIGYIDSDLAGST